MFVVEAEMLQAVHVRPAVAADGRHDQRFPAEQLQRIGDVAGAAAELPPHLRHQEGHVQNVDLLWQDMVLEAIMENHDCVISNRTANQCFHGWAGAEK